MQFECKLCLVELGHDICVFNYCFFYITNLKYFLAMFSNRYFKFRYLYSVIFNVIFLPDYGLALHAAQSMHNYCPHFALYKNVYIKTTHFSVATLSLKGANETIAHIRPLNRCLVPQDSSLKARQTFPHLFSVFSRSNFAPYLRSVQ